MGITTEVVASRLAARLAEFGVELTDAEGFATAFAGDLVEWVGGAEAVPVALATKVTTTANAWNTDVMERIDWWTGPADGGPNGDGLYPMTNAAGVTTLFPSLAKIFQMVGTVGDPAEVIDEVTGLVDQALAAKNTLRDRLQVFLVPTGGTDLDGGALPPWHVADLRTGLLQAWVDAVGKLRAARNGGDEVATLLDIAPFAAIGDVMAVTPDGAQDIDGGALPPWHVADLRTGLLQAWVDVAGKLRAARNGGDEVATLLDIAPFAAIGTVLGVKPDGSVDGDGAALPPWYVADKASGRLLAWIDLQGKYHVARNGGDEPATLTDIAAFAAMAQVVKLVTDGVDDNGNPLPKYGLVSRKTGHYLEWWDDATGAMKSAAVEAANGGAASKLLVQYDKIAGTLAISAKSPKAGSVYWITYTYKKSGSTTSLNYWYRDSIYITTRSGNVMTNVAMVEGAGASAITGVWGETGYGAHFTADTTSGSANITVTAKADGTIAVGQEVFGSGIQAGARIQSLGTGTGGTGTYVLTKTATATASGVAVATKGNAASNLSIDNDEPIPTSSPENFFGQPAHGNCHPIAFEPMQVSPALLVEMDGDFLDLDSNALVEPSYVRLRQAASVPRSRVPAITDPAMLTFEDVMFTPADQLAGDGVMIFQEQLTAAGFVPLLCITNIFDTLQRDHNGKVELIPLPPPGTPLTDLSTIVTEDIPGVSHLIYSSSADGYVCDIQLGPAEWFAAGQYPWGDRLPNAGDSFQVKVSDPQRKAYFTVGARAGVYRGVPAFQAQPGDILRRRYTLKVIA